MVERSSDHFPVNSLLIPCSLECGDFAEGQEAVLDALSVLMTLQVKAPQDANFPCIFP